MRTQDRLDFDGRRGGVDKFSVPDIDPDVRDAMAPEPAMLGRQRLESDDVARLQLFGGNADPAKARHVPGVQDRHLDVDVLQKPVDKARAGIALIGESSQVGQAVNLQMLLVPQRTFPHP